MRYRHGFLVATPRHQENPFSQSVVYICEHSTQGALGLVINKPLTLSVTDLMKTSFGVHDSVPVYFGGPVQTQECGFILHRNLGQYWEGTTQLASDLYLTTTKDLLTDLASYPEDLYKVMVGYTAWQNGQIEYEMSQDYWVWVPYDSHVLFETMSQAIWLHCYNLLGFVPDQIGCVDPGAIFIH